MSLEMVKFQRTMMERYKALKVAKADVDEQLASTTTRLHACEVEKAEALEEKIRWQAKIIDVQKQVAEEVARIQEEAGKMQQDATAERTRLQGEIAQAQQETVAVAIKLATAEGQKKEAVRKIKP